MWMTATGHSLRYDTNTPRKKIDTQFPTPKIHKDNHLISINKLLHFRIPLTVVNTLSNIQKRLVVRTVRRVDNENTTGMRRMTTSGSRVACFLKTCRRGIWISWRDEVGSESYIRVRPVHRKGRGGYDMMLFFSKKPYKHCLWQTDYIFSLSAFFFCLPLVGFGHGIRYA